MPPRSTVDLLPLGVREELDHRLMESAFGGYEGHAAWLAGQGHTVSMSAVKRYGRRRKADSEASAAKAQEITAKAIARARTASEMATAMRRAAGDDELAVPTATVDMLMMRMQEALANDELDVKALQALAQSVNQNMRALASLRHEREADRHAVMAVAESRVTSVMKKQSFSEAMDGNHQLADALRKALKTPPSEMEIDTERERAKESLRAIREDVYGVHEGADYDEWLDANEARALWREAQQKGLSKAAAEALREIVQRPDCDPVTGP
ncbi:MAG: DUF3486 family protein [Boseongicola sp. SB0662_bin_57]|nr:DUF3486 family protein [Boseongicola sp. SB0662_bin_57]